MTDGRTEQEQQQQEEQSRGQEEEVSALLIVTEEEDGQEEDGSDDEDVGGGDDDDEDDDDSLYDDDDDDDDSDDNNAVQNREHPFGCKHYPRKCALLSPCCGTYVACRLCHNENVFSGGVVKQVQVHAAGQDRKGSGDEGGRGDGAVVGKPCSVEEMDRYAVQRVMCLVCGAADQPTLASSLASSIPQFDAAQQEDVPGRSCVECGVVFARYHCPRCNLYDDTPDKHIFHCDRCDMCRVGKREDFVHCDTCNACVPHDHDRTRCLQDVMHAGCPVCLENLHTSTRAVVFMRCGHAIHQRCRAQMLSSGMYTCPMCSKLIVDSDLYNAEMERVVSSSPMPEEYRDMRVSVLCNECGWTGECAFHVFGHKCQQCGSYNTKRT